MLALVRDYFRRSWLLATLGAIAIFAFLLFASRVFLQIQQRGGGSPLTKLVPQWVQSAFNIGPMSMSDLNGFLSVIFQHPFVLTVLLGVPVALITAFLSGDVEKRTISLVLTRPVSRVTVVAACAIVIIVLVITSLVSVQAGCLVGAAWTNQSASLNGKGIQNAVLSLGLLVFAFTGIAAVISSVISVRGDAVGWSLTVILVMYVWNFLAQIWSGGVAIFNFSLFHFYQPTEILLHGNQNFASLGILGITGIIGWFAAGLVFRFRSFSV